MIERLPMVDVDTVSLWEDHFFTAHKRFALTRFGTVDRSDRDSTLPLIVCVEPSDMTKTLRARLAGHRREKAVDSIIVTNPVGDCSSWHAVSAGWPYLEDLVLEQKVFRLGVSDFGEIALGELVQRARVPPAFNCIELHPYCQAKSLRTFCSRLEIAVHANCWHGPRSPDGGLILNQELVIQQMNSRLNCSTTSILLAWSLQCAAGTHVTSDHAEWISGVFETDLPLLTPTDLKNLDSLDCEWRIRRDKATLSSLFGTVATGMSVKPAETSGLQYGLYRNMYLPLTRSTAFNRQISHFLWRWVFNLPASLTAAIKPAHFGPLATRLANELKRDGIAVTSLSEMDMLDQLPALVTACDQLKVDVVKQEQTSPQKDYRYYTASPASCCLSAMNIIHEAARNYLGLTAIPTDFQISIIPPRRKAPVKQQHWHTDIEDFSLLKILIYLNEVRTAEDGPLFYVKGSHPFGCYSLFTAELMHTTFVRDPEPGMLYVVPDQQFFRVVNPNLVSEIYGPVGTVILMDPRGFHKGGHALRQPRAVLEGTLLAPHQIHPLPGAPSFWRYLLFPLRWKNCSSKYRPFTYGPQSFADHISRLTKAAINTARFSGPRKAEPPR